MMSLRLNRHKDHDDPCQPCSPKSDPQWHSHGRVSDTLDPSTGVQKTLQLVHQEGTTDDSIRACQSCWRTTPDNLLEPCGTLVCMPFRGSSRSPEAQEGGWRWKVSLGMPQAGYPVRIAAIVDLSAQHLQPCPSRWSLISIQTWRCMGCTWLIICIHNELQSTASSQAELA